MTYDCIICGYTWVTDNEPSEITSSGLCKPCLKKRLEPIAHKEQIKYSGIPCYATAKGYCDQYACKYYKICVEVADI